MKKERNDIMDALTANCNTSNQIVTKEIPSPEDTIVDVEDDFTYARNHIKGLINTSDDAIEMMHNLASDAEHPRAFEVLGNLIKQNAEMNNQLMDLSKSRKDLRNDDTSNTSSSTTNNAIFVGTTTELQKLLLNNKDSVIDVE